MNEKIVFKDFLIYNFIFIVNFFLCLYWKCAMFNFKRIRFIVFFCCMNVNKML